MYKRYNREIRRRDILGGLFSLLLQYGHFLPCTKISQTKCYKQSDTLFQLIFACSFRWSVQFSYLCCIHCWILRGCWKSKTDQKPPSCGLHLWEQWKTVLKNSIELFVAFCFTYLIAWQVVCREVYVFLEWVSVSTFGYRFWGSRNQMKINCGWGVSVLDNCR